MKLFKLEWKILVKQKYVFLIYSLKIQIAIKIECLKAIV